MGCMPKLTSGNMNFKLFLSYILASLVYSFIIVFQLT